MNFVGTPYLCYDSAAEVWDAGGSIKIAGAEVETGPPPYDGIFFGSNGAFLGGAIKKATFTPGLPLAPPLLLTGFSGGYGTHPTRIAASVTISVADLLEIEAGGFAVWASHEEPFRYEGQKSAPYDIPGRNALQKTGPIENFAFGIGGTVYLPVPVLGRLQLAGGYVFYEAPSYFEFGGFLGYDWEGGHCTNGSAWCVGGAVEGALDTGNGEYNIQGNLGACADFPGSSAGICLNLFGVASSSGLGACGELGGSALGADIGLTYAYSSRSFNFILGGSFLGIRGGTSCSEGLGPIEVHVQASDSRAHTAGAFTTGTSAAHEAGTHTAGTHEAGTHTAGTHTAGTHTGHAAGASTAPAPGGGGVNLALPAHQLGSVITVKGVGGTAPALTISGPHGEQFSEPAGGGRSGNIIIWPEPKLGYTWIEIAHPEAGNWTLTPAPGAPAIAEVDTQQILPRAAIKASVGGHGRRRTLTYKVLPSAGQKVTFAERAGRVFRVLGTAHGSRGKLSFTPAPGPGGRRKIIALVSLSGAPKPEMVVGGYTAPSPPTAGAVHHLSLQRRGNTLRVSWQAATNASSYLATVTLSDGQRTTYEEPARTRTVTVPRVPPSTGAHVQVSAMTSLGAGGHAAAATLAPPAAPRPVTGLRVTHSGGAVVISWHRARGAKVYLLSVTTGAGGAQDPRRWPSAPRASARARRSAR